MRVISGEGNVIGECGEECERDGFSCSLVVI